MASTSKATRECTRAPKRSILLSNVIGISFTPYFDVTKQHDTTNDPNKPQETGKALFNSFIQENKSTLHTTLNESLSELRFAGWIQPFTLLVKGPQEELEVIKEAWRRRFLRSPVHFTIREMGTIKSVDSEIIQQAPFLPLTKAVYEAIAALNQNSLPSGQQNVFEYLAHTYQYVHVPKPNVIRDSLGILFKEGRVYSSGGNYFVLVDSESENSETKKKENKPTKEKIQERHTRCNDCESTNYITNSGHAQTELNTKGIAHAHLCEKHKRGEKRINKKMVAVNEHNSLTTSSESKDLKCDKKEQRNTSGDNSKKPIENLPKKTVWGQIACFIKGKHESSRETSQDDHKSIKSRDKTFDAKNSNAVGSPLIDKPDGRIQNTKPILEPVIQEETKKTVDLPKVSQTDNPGRQVERSKSFVAQNKKRPNLVRSNTFDTGMKIARPVDQDITRSKLRIDEHNRCTSNGNPQSQVISFLKNQSSLAEKAVYLNTSDFVGPTTPAKLNSEKASIKKQNFRPQSTDSFKERRSTPAVIEADKLCLNQSNMKPSKDRINACAVGIVRPWSTHVQSASAESRPVSKASSMKETQKLPVQTCITTCDFNRTTLRDSKFIKRSVSVTENRKSDCTPLTSQRYVGSINRDLCISDSPLKHILTKNTGNTLPVSQSHPSYNAVSSIQSRVRNTTSNRNSFPSGNTSFKRNSWRASSLAKHDENRDNLLSKETGILFQEEKPKRLQDMFPFDYMNQNHLGKRVVPCDCIDGHSENFERRSVSSDPYYNTPTSIHKDEHSSICSNSQSDNSILLDEISSSGSSEIQSIMNQNKNIESQQSPYAVAKGEVVLDSSLTFIGII